MAGEKPFENSIRRPDTEPSDQADHAVFPACEDLGDYVAEMCGSMAVMTRAARQPMLTYFLSLARMEAKRLADASDGSAI